MPSYRCSHKVCTNYVKTSGDYCDDHAAMRGERFKVYDQTKRNPDSRKFYNSQGWKRARTIKLFANPFCERCGTFAEHVHHVHPLASCTYDQKVNPKWLLSVCASCHNAIEAEDAKR